MQSEAQQVVRLVTCPSRKKLFKVSLTQNPILPLKQVSEWGMGFLHGALKRVQNLSRGTPKHPPKNKLIAIDVGQSHLLVLAIQREDKVKISNFRLEPRPSSPGAVSARLKAIFQEENLDPAGVRTALKTQGMVIRILTFPQMKRAELASMLQYEVEKYIPFKSNEVVIDFDILEENIHRGDMKSMEILLVAVKQTEVREFYKIFQEAGLQLEAIGIGAAAMANSIEALFPEVKGGTVGFVDMGRGSSTFGIVVKGKPVFIRDISFGGADVLKLLKRKLGVEAEKAASLLKDPAKILPEHQTVIEQGLSNLVNELRLSLGYYMDHVPGAVAVETLFVTGGGFRLISLKSLENQLKITVRRLEILSRVELESGVDASAIKENEDLLLPALGLCL